MRKIVLLLLVFFSFCTRKMDEMQPVVHQQSPVMQVNAKEMLRSLAPELGTDLSCLGEIEDNRVSCDFFRKRYIWPDDMGGYRRKVNLKIVIDTNSFYTDGYLFEYTDDEKKKLSTYENRPVEERENLMYEDYVKKKETLKNRRILSYPVKIYNNDSQEIMFYNGSMIQEALDTDGIWKPIEFLFFPSVCGTPYVGTVIPTLRPQHFSLTSIVKYHGNFKTKVRVKFAKGYQIFYSNVITAYINRSQFSLKAIDDFLLYNDECANDYMYHNNLEEAFLEYEKYANDPEYIMPE